MNKKILVIVVAALLLLGGGYFFLNSRKSITLPGSQTSAPSSLKDLITKGIPQSCTFSGEGESGSVFVSGKKVRGDFDTTVEGKVTKSHMIVDGNTSYLWTDDQKEGFKMTFDVSAVDASPEPGTATSGESFDANANMNYKCSPWLEDSSKFALPSGVTFTSFAMPSAQPGASGSGSSQCSYCDSLTGDSKTQCLTALNCK